MCVGSARGQVIQSRFQLSEEMGIVSFFSCDCTSTLFRFSFASVHAFLFIPDFASARELVQSALNSSHLFFFF